MSKIEDLTNQELELYELNQLLEKLKSDFHSIRSNRIKIILNENNIKEVIATIMVKIKEHERKGTKLLKLDKEEPKAPEQPKKPAPGG